jgi:hypothetical protein
MKKVRVRYKKLGQQQALGIHYPTRNLIEIDERLKGKRLLGTQVHEAIHHAMPELTEEKVLEIEKVITDILWEAKKQKEKCLSQMNK